MEAVRALVLLVAAGCGRVAFDPSADAGSGGDDAGTDEGCWPAWRAHTISVSAPRRIDELSGGSDESNPFLASDGLTLYFNIMHPTERRNLYTAVRSAPGQPFSPAVPVTELNDGADEGRLTLSGDGLIAVFTSTRTSSSEDVWMSVRSSPSLSFPAPTQTLVTALNSLDNEVDSELSRDGLRLYLSSWGPGVTERILMTSRASVTEAFGPTIVVTSIDPGTVPADPTLSPDELVIVFAREAGAQNVNDLYYATRASRSDDWGPAVIVPSVNDSSPSANDGDSALSNDGCELFFKANRTGVSNDLYVADIARP